MALPDNYDLVSIKVNGAALNDAATTIFWAINSISNSLKDIDDSLNGLKLGWVGTAATDATDFNDKWAAAMKSLFGTDANPSSGVLNAVYGGVSQAADNYGKNEQSIVLMWNHLANALNQQGSSSSAPSDVIDKPFGNPAVYHTTAVNETGTMSTVDLSSADDIAAGHPHVKPA